MYLTEETICFNINGNDLIYDLCTPDPDIELTFDETTRVGDNSIYKNVILSEDFAINMGCHLDSSVKEYYCEVIQYVYNNWYDDGTQYDSSIQNFTQLYSNLSDNDYIKSDMTENLNKARFPLTQPQSAKISQKDTNQFGLTKHSCGCLQKTSFICKNFNQQIKWFRIASIRTSSKYSFFNISSWASRFTYGSSKTELAFASNINNEDDRVGYLKIFPHAIMYMTPIYADRVPRLLDTNKKISMIISSQERIYGVDGYALNCIIPIPQLNESTRFKAVFKSLNLSCSLRCGELDKPRLSFPMHLFKNLKLDTVHNMVR